MKNASMKASILIPALSVLATGVILMVVITGSLSSSTVNNLTGRLIDARVSQYTNEFQVLCRDAYGAVMSLAPAIRNVAKNSEDPRAEILLIMEGALEGNGNIYDIWSCWEPNALDGKDSTYANTSFYDATGRFIPVVYRDGNGFGVEPLVGYDDAVEGEYYQGAKSTRKPYITDPYLYSIAGSEILLYSITIPIIEGGSVVGAVGMDIDLQNVIAAMNAGSILDDGYLFTISPGGVFATHSNADLLEQSYKTTWLGDYSTEIDGILQNGGSFSITAYSDVLGDNVRFLGSGVMIGDTGVYWCVCGVVPDKTVYASSRTLLLLMILIGAALIVVVGATIFWIIRKQLSRLPAIMKTAGAIAVGDIAAANMRVNMTEKTKNEIVLLERAFAHMADGIGEQAGVLSKIADGDYSVHIPVRSDADVMNIATNSMIDSTNSVLTEIKKAAFHMQNGSVQIAAGAQTLATGSTQQAASLEEISEAVSEIQAHAHDSAGLSRDTKSAMDETGVLMSRCMENMAQLTGSMEMIGRSSRDIVNVIKAIDEIAFQTNILALNAAVEAAHAGQHGKGFAVVADEVRALAAKSAEASKESTSLIQNSVDNIEKGMQIAARTAESLEAAGALSQSNAVNMDKLSAMSEQQAASINGIHSGVGQISDVIQANSAAAEQNAASAEEMSAQASMLNEIVGRFRLRQSGEPEGFPERETHPFEPGRAPVPTSFSLSADKY